MRIDFFVKYLAVLLMIAFYTNTIYAQKVGVVLSGGGAGGACHVGVLKALEQNNIPIDYITGTSIGALIGGMYASGYSPEEIEKIATSDEFINITKGIVNTRYQYYFFKKDNNASWITLKVSLDSSLVTNLPTNFVNSAPIDFETAQFFTNSAMACGYNFDSLFVPFRCVASDVENKKARVFKQGALNEAIRASMTYPLYLRPIFVGGTVLFDGGLYDNFPADIMYNEFKPDYIIGSVVTGTNPKINDENLYSQLRNILVTNPDFSLKDKTGIIIEPWSDVGTFNFESSRRLIDSGYVATQRLIDSIKMSVKQYRIQEEVTEKRHAFKNKMPEKIIIDEIEMHGLNKKQQQYVKRLFMPKKKEFTLDDMKWRYFRLSQNDKIRSIFPTLVYNPQSGKYKLNLKIKREKDLFVQFGGNLSTRPISTGFVALQYNYLSKIAMSVYGNAYFGRLNSSGSGRIRFDIPGNIPFYIEPNVTISVWDYYRSSTLFYTLQKPSYLTQHDKYGELNFGLPVGNMAKTVFGGGVAQLDNVYYQTDNFTNKDTADQTNFQFAYANAEYELNTLNRKLYASEGAYLNVRAKYINGLESLIPGTTTNETKELNIPHEWYMFKAKFDYYLKPFKFFKIGILGEGVYSTQNLFLNYTSSVLSAPAFMPTPESKTLFLPNFRAYQYAAGGAKMIFHPIRKLDIRFEAYLFQPYQAINKNSDLTASLGKPFADRYILGMAALVYHTQLGPLSVSVNYYHNEVNPFTFLLHFGYTIFNRKSIE